MNFDPRTDASRRWAIRVIILLAAYQVAIGTYFIALRPPLLPEDLRFLKLATIPEGLVPWLRLVFAVLGGQMVASGLLLVPFIKNLRSGSGSGALDLACFIGAGLVSVGVMSAVNLMLRSDFRWVLLVPALAWGVAVLLVRASRASS
jgi:hypothetical protein